MNKELFPLVQKFDLDCKERRTCIGVTGDVILDLFSEHSYERQSSEDNDTPIYVQENLTKSPGGAGNLAANIRNLGANVHLVTVTGADVRSDDLWKLLSGAGIVSSIVQDVSRPTTIKRRIISNEKNDPVKKLRFTEARESRAPISDDIAAIVEQKIRKMNIDVLIVSDYARGMITRPVLDSIRRIMVEGKKMKVLVDPHPNPNYGLEDLRDFYLLKPNTNEVRKLLGIKPEFSDEELPAILASICRENNNQQMLVTKSENGMALYGCEGVLFNLPSLAKQVVSVSGAGDTVMAVLAIALAIGMDIEDAMRLASAGAAIVVAQPGTSILQMDELYEFARINDRANGYNGYTV